MDQPPGTAVDPARSWNSMPPLQRTIRSFDRTLDEGQFEQDLASHKRPAEFLAPLGHVISGQGPHGLIAGIAAPVPSVQASEGPESRAFARKFDPPVVQRSLTQFSPGDHLSHDAAAGASAGAGPQTSPGVPPATADVMAPRSEGHSPSAEPSITTVDQVPHETESPTQESGSSVGPAATHEEEPEPTAPVIETAMTEAQSPPTSPPVADVPVLQLRPLETPRMTPPDVDRGHDVDRMHKSGVRAAPTRSPREPAPPSSLFATGHDRAGEKPVAALPVPPEHAGSKPSPPEEPRSPEPSVQRAVGDSSILEEESSGPAPSPAEPAHAAEAIDTSAAPSVETISPTLGRSSEPRRAGLGPAMTDAVSQGLQRSPDESIVPRSIHSSVHGDARRKEASTHPEPTAPGSPSVVVGAEAGRTAGLGPPLQGMTVLKALQRRHAESPSGKSPAGVTPRGTDGRASEGSFDSEVDNFVSSATSAPSRSTAEPETVPDEPEGPAAVQLLPIRHLPRALEGRAQTGGSEQSLAPLQMITEAKDRVAGLLGHRPMAPVQRVDREAAVAEMSPEPHPVHAQVTRETSSVTGSSAPRSLGPRPQATASDDGPVGSTGAWPGSMMGSHGPLDAATAENGRTPEQSSGEYTPPSPTVVSRFAAATTVVPAPEPPADTSAPSVQAVPAETPTVVQRIEEAPPAAAEVGGPAEANVDELANKLYDRIRSKLRAELRLDRERAGLVTDLRR